MAELVTWQAGRLAGGAVPRVVGHITYDPRHPASLGPSARLIPRDLCAAAIAEADWALQPAGEDIGLKQARNLLSAFPNADKSDPKVYVTAIKAVLSGCPVEIGKQVVTDVVLSHAYGLPPVAVVAKRAQELMRPIVNARSMAAAYLREHERRDEKERRRKDGRNSSEGMTEEYRSELEAFIAARLGVQVMRSTL